MKSYGPAWSLNVAPIFKGSGMSHAADFILAQVRSALPIMLGFQRLIGFNSLSPLRAKQDHHGLCPKPGRAERIAR